MNREETKKKLVEELKKGMAPIEYGGDREHAPEVHYPTEDEIAEALIEAGLRFTESLTATFNKMDLPRMTLEQAKDAAKNGRPVWYTDRDGTDHEASVVFAAGDIAEIEYGGKYMIVRLKEMRE